MFPGSLLAGGYNPFEEYWSNWIFSPSNLTRLIGMRWSALRQHGISGHLMWILQCMYYGQTGVVRERDVGSYVRDVYLALVCSAGAGNGLVLLACENGS